jgi:hypothetical protein
LSTDNVLQALQDLLARNSDGLSVIELQTQVYHNFKLQLSYKVIENTIFRYPGLFVDAEGKWKLRGGTPASS